MVTRTLFLAILLWTLLPNIVFAEVGQSTNDFTLVRPTSTDSVEGLLAEAQLLFIE